MYWYLLVSFRYIFLFIINFLTGNAGSITDITAGGRFWQTFHPFVKQEVDFFLIFSSYTLRSIGENGFE